MISKQNMALHSFKRQMQLQYGDLESFCMHQFAYTYVSVPMYKLGRINQKIQSLNALKAFPELIRVYRGDEDNFHIGKYSKV